MIRIVLEVDSDNIIGVKESLAMELEKHGDIRVISVAHVDLWQQMTLTGGGKERP